MDQGAGFARAHEASSYRLGHEHGGLEIETQNRVIILLAHLLDRLGPVRARVVDEDIERRRVGEQRDRVQIGQVQRQWIGHAAIRPDRVRRQRDLARRPRGQRHMRPCLRQRGGRRQPNPPPRPGHERAAAVQAEGGGVGEHHRAGCSRGSATPA